MFFKPFISICLLFFAINQIKTIDLTETNIELKNNTEKNVELNEKVFTEGGTIVLNKTDENKKKPRIVPKKGVSLNIPLLPASVEPPNEISSQKIDVTINKPTSPPNITSETPGILANSTTTQSINLILSSTEQPEEQPTKLGNETVQVIETTNGTTPSTSTTIEATSSTTTTTTTTTTLPPPPKKPTASVSVLDDPEMFQQYWGTDKNSNISTTSSTASSTQSTLTTSSSTKLSVEEPEVPVVQFSKEKEEEEIPMKPKDNRQYIVPVIILVVAVPIVLGLVTFMSRRLKEYWSTRHYRRMDFLVDGMYND